MSSPFSQKITFTTRVSADVCQSTIIYQGCISISRYANYRNKYMRKVDWQSFLQVK